MTSAQMEVSSTGVQRTEVSSATIATVERAADVLLYFTQVPDPDLGVTEIAKALELSKAAVHRILASLRGRGFIDLDEKTRRYTLGVAAMRLGLAYTDRIDIRRLAHPYLVKLSERTNETATLSIRTGRTRIYVDQETPEREVIMSVALGEPYPLHAGASSKAFLAFLPSAEIEEYLQGPLDTLTPGTLVDSAKLREELEQIRMQGWATSSAERKPGAASVAAPVLDARGVPTAVISVSGPTDRFFAEIDHCREALLSVTNRLGRQMGYRPKAELET